MTRSNFARRAQRKQQTRLSFGSMISRSSLTENSPSQDSENAEDSVFVVSSDYPQNEKISNIQYSCISVFPTQQVDSNPGVNQLNHSSLERRVNLSGGGLNKLYTRKLKLPPILYNTDSRAINSVSESDQFKIVLVRGTSPKGPEIKVNKHDEVCPKTKQKTTGNYEERPDFRPTHCMKISNVNTLTTVTKINSRKNDTELIDPRKNSQTLLQELESFKKFPSRSHENRAIISDSRENDSYLKLHDVSQEHLYSELSSPLKRRQAALMDLDVDDKTSIKACDSCFPIVDLNDTDDSEDIVSPSKNRHDRKSKRKQIYSRAQSFKDESDRRLSQKHYTRQQRVKRHRTTQKKTLELIRRKRNGENIQSVTDSETPSDYESDHSFQALSVFEDEHRDEHESNTPGFYDNDREVLEGKRSVSDDLDFVIEDESFLGVPHDMVTVPLQFTSSAHRPLKEHFRDAIEWMVKKQIDLDFVQDDEIYIQAFRKLDDICEGLAKRNFTSTQWTPNFTQAIWTRPYFFSQKVGGRENCNSSTRSLKCNACNHKRHVPVWCIQVGGRTYDKYTLAEIYDSSELHECSLMPNNIDYDPLEFFVGSTCRKKAYHSHRLIHWKYNLNKCIGDKLLHDGYLEAAKMREIKNMKRIKRDQHANKLIDTWNAEGFITHLYREWKTCRTMTERFV